MISRLFNTEILRRGHCIPFPHFTELDPRDAIAICRQAGGCPAMHECAQLGLDPPPMDPGDTVVFGGMKPSVRWKLSRGKRRR